MQLWYLYVIKTIDQLLYTGITTDTARRFNEHLNKSSKSAKFLIAHKPDTLIFSQLIGTRSLALKVEYHFKQLSKETKLSIIKRKLLLFDISSGKIVTTVFEQLPDKGLTMSQDLVYSTEHGSMCPKCTNALTRCVCKKIETPPSGSKVRVSRSLKGRNGKTVSLISGLPLDESSLVLLAKELKQFCGTGGTVKDGSIEIQGDHTEKILTELVKRGFSAKRSGG